MRFKFIYPAMLLVVALILASCNGVDNIVNRSSETPAATPATVHADGARRITTSELEALMKDGKAFLVDVRNQDAYDLGHIPGSLLIPAGDIANHLKELPSDKTIVTYCS
jgi:3-mercaptopyruvate sulfurtransferase SseA